MDRLIDMADSLVYGLSADVFHATSFFSRRVISELPRKPCQVAPSRTSAIVIAIPEISAGILRPGKFTRIIR